MDWPKGAFGPLGLPVPKGPKEAEPRKRIERGEGSMTKEWLYDRPAALPNFAPGSSSLQGRASSGKAPSWDGAGDVVATPVDSSAKHRPALLLEKKEKGIGQR